MPERATGPGPRGKHMIGPVAAPQAAWLVVPPNEYLDWRLPEWAEFEKLGLICYRPGAGREPVAAVTVDASLIRVITAIRTLRSLGAPA